ncbi:MAG: hypothetical protein FWG30_09815 [Eubacteriaceae bacterium]|nr:hypothetical protein [Eubacteriaceae bacterium]
MDTMELELFDSKGHISSDYLSQMDEIVLYDDEKKRIGQHVSTCQRCAANYSKAVAQHVNVRAPSSLADTIRDNALARESKSDGIYKAAAIIIGVAITSYLVFYGQTLYGPLSIGIQRLSGGLGSFHSFLGSVVRNAKEALSKIDLGGLIHK